MVKHVSIRDQTSAGDGPSEAPRHDEFATPIKEVLVALVEVWVELWVFSDHLLELVPSLLHFLLHMYEFIHQGFILYATYIPHSPLEHRVLFHHVQIGVPEGPFAQQLVPKDEKGQAIELCISGFFIVKEVRVGLEYFFELRVEDLVGADDQFIGDSDDDFVSWDVLDGGDAGESLVPKSSGIAHLVADQGPV